MTPLYIPDFQEEGHIFRWGGQIVPSITKILSDSGLFEFNFCTQEGLERGSRVHKATEMFDRGTLDWNSVDESEIGYVQAYEKFILDTGFKPEIIEEKLYSPTFGFAGIPDRAGKLNGRNVIVEIKTGVENRRYERLQTAAQYILLTENYTDYKISSRIALHIKNDGSYSIGKPFLHHSKDISQFMALKTIYNLKNSKEE